MAEPFNLFDPNYQRDPYATDARMRERDPIHWDADRNRWTLFRHADATAVARRRGLGSGDIVSYLRRTLPADVLAAARPVIEGYSLEMLWLDPPEHTRQRSLITKAFTVRRIEAMRPQIAAVADELLDAVLPAGQMDVAHDFAYPLTQIVIADMLGVLPEDRAAYFAWNDDLSAFRARLRSTPDKVGLAQRAAASHTALSDYLIRQIAARHARPRDDLLTALVQAEEDGERLGQAELIALCILLLRAGHHTTANLITSGVYLLLRHPEQLQALRKDPDLVGQAVEEFLRYEAPISGNVRTVQEAFTLQGHQIEAGTEIGCQFSSVNRDPAAFADPDHLDISRTDNSHMSFGFGFHYCLGAHLARLEAQIGIGTLVRQLPNLTLATEEVEWQASGYRGLTALPVTF